MTSDAEEQAMQMIDYHAELQTLKQRIEQLETENKALRKIVFSRVHGEKAEESDIPEITLPYTIKHKVVIFGGHDSWLKAIRPMLKNVRFVGGGQAPDANLIKRADVIWIQTNAMAHRCYAVIIDVARSYGIAVRYFTSASAERCAKEIAREDTQGKYLA